MSAPGDLLARSASTAGVVVSRFNSSFRSVVIKVGMLGDSQIGKTSLMVKYVEGHFDEDYIQTLGAPPRSYRHMSQAASDAVAHVRCELHGEDDHRPEDVHHVLALGSWRATRVCQHASLGLQRRSRNSIHVRPITEIDAELSKRVVSTSTGIQQGMPQVTVAQLYTNPTRNATTPGHQTAIPFLIGTKFDTFSTFPRDEREEITKQVSASHHVSIPPSQCAPPPTSPSSAGQAKRFAKAMHASLIFCSTSASINVQKIFKIVLAKAFDLKCVIPEIDGVGEPILMYVDV